MDGCWHIWTDAGKSKTARVRASSWSAAATQWIVCQVSHTHRALCTAIKIRLIKFNTQLWASSLHGNTNTMGRSTALKAFISVAIALSHYNMSVTSLPKTQLTLRKTQCNSTFKMQLMHFLGALHADDMSDAPFQLTKSCKKEKKWNFENAKQTYHCWGEALIFSPVLYLHNRTTAGKDAS